MFPSKKAKTYYKTSKFSSYLPKKVKSDLHSCLLTVAQFAEPIEDIPEAVVHGRQRLQLDLLEVFRTLVLQVTVSFADAAHNSWRLERKKFKDHK